MELQLRQAYNNGAVLQEFQQKFPDFGLLVSDFYNVRNTVGVFRERGSIHCKKGAGRPKLCTNEVVGGVQQRMENSPSTLVRYLSQEVGLSLGLCHSILIENFNETSLHPVKIGVWCAVRRIIRLVSFEETV
ncbi:hypothetical protein Zmor_014348 [Zophobas morio]|uniref:Uncharacterized protein n=1 Tax=Zophobas morio TaxID=2755281 RepID=A0AA38IJH6_9CUCU|nr:hypothetical protein Zmor_014348 [Zophobas morio]